MNIQEVTDFSREQFEELVEKTLFFHKNKNKQFKTLKNKHIGLLFDAASLRTKLSFEIATNKLGGFPYYIPIDSVTHEKDKTLREDIADIIETLDRFIDVYVIRNYSQDFIKVLIKKENPPFINGFSIIGHPSQALADISVIKLNKKELKNIYCICPSTGSGVIESFVYGVLLLGKDITIITPSGKFNPKNKDFYENIEKLKGKLTITNNIDISKADILYVDEWWTNEKDFIKKIPKIQVNQEFLKEAKKDLIILHCLPAHHDREIAKNIFYSQNSIVFEEAEFRIYSAMALLEFIFK